MDQQDLKTEPLTAGGETMEGDGDSGRRPSRPTVVVVLAVFSLASALVHFVGVSALASVGPGSVVGFARMGVHRAVGVPLFLLLAVASAAAGVLMLTGRRAGWVLLVAVLAFSALWAAHLVILGVAVPGHMRFGDGEAGVWIAKRAAQFVLTVGALMCVHLRIVRAYFGASGRRRSVLAIGLGALAFVIVIGADAAAEALSGRG